jgi:hypothetical protein
MPKKTDYTGKKIPSHNAWEKSKQDSNLDKRGGAHAKEGSKADLKADEAARKAHNAKVASRKK